jgi:hypothetical protein
VTFALTRPMPFEPFARHAHWGQWHFMPSETHPMGGMQFQVTLLAILVYLVLNGNGVNEAGPPTGDLARAPLQPPA